MSQLDLGAIWSVTVFPPRKCSFIISMSGTVHRSIICCVSSDLYIVMRSKIYGLALCETKWSELLWWRIYYVLCSRSGWTIVGHFHSTFHCPLYSNAVCLLGSTVMQATCVIFLRQYRPNIHDMSVWNSVCQRGTLVCGLNKLKLKVVSETYIHVVVRSLRCVKCSRHAKGGVAINRLPLHVRRQQFVWKAVFVGHDAILFTQT